MLPTLDARRTGLRVLIIDPHEVSRAAVRALLQTEGLEVIADVATAADALTLERLLPDVVIIDLTCGADEALGAAKALAQLASMPAVVLTSSALPKIDVDGYVFIAKSELCAKSLRTLSNDQL